MRNHHAFAWIAVATLFACTDGTSQTTASETGAPTTGTSDPGTTDVDPTTGTTGMTGTTALGTTSTTDTTGGVSCEGDGPCDCARVAVLGLQGAKSGAMFEAFLDQHRPGWQRFDDIDPLTAEALQGFDTLIVTELIRTYDADEAAALHDWVEAGGGLLVLSGYFSSPDGANSLLVPLEVQFQAMQLHTLIGGYGAHPLMKGISALPFDGNFPIVDAKGDGVTVVHGEGNIYGLASTRGSGRVFLFADEWVTYDGGWSGQTEQFWTNALAWLNVGDGTCGPAPLYAETCAELRAEHPGAGDGTYTLYVGHAPDKPWAAYCKDMGAEPVEYLPLVNVQEGRNFSQYTAGGPSPGTDVRTRFTRLRIDPVTLIVDIDDLTFSSSTGELLHDGQPVTAMPYAVAEGCLGGEANGVANIDLVGTPFKLIEPFCTKGFMPLGEAILSMNDQVADLTGGGSCGWTSPALGDVCIAYNPQGLMNGPALDLAYIGL